ncbi:MAG: hypothetical protein QXI27_02280 [Nitrososphaerota archaeon]
MVADSMVESLLRHHQSQKIIEELLDIALTTMNTAKISPMEGEQLASYFINNSLNNKDAISILLKIDLAAEPEKTLSVLNKYGVRD